MNEKQMTVMYLVVAGKSESYRVASMWSSKEDAQAECNRGNSGYDARVEEYFLNVPEFDGARRKVSGFLARYEVRAANGVVTADDVRVKPFIFKGELEDTSCYYQRSGMVSPHIIAYSSTKEKAASLALKKFAEVEKEKGTASSF